LGQNTILTLNTLPERRQRVNSNDFLADSRIDERQIKTHGGSFRRLIRPIMGFILPPWQLFFMIPVGWMNRQQQKVIDNLRTENQVPKEKCSKKRILQNDDHRRCLTVKGRGSDENDSKRSLDSRKFLSCSTPETRSYCILLKMR
jgi:hypothetical protein